VSEFTENDLRGIVKLLTAARKSDLDVLEFPVYRRNNQDHGIMLGLIKKSVTTVIRHQYPHHGPTESKTSKFIFIPGEFEKVDDISTGDKAGQVI
jgi:hypothetical protein